MTKSYSHAVDRGYMPFTKLFTPLEAKLRRQIYMRRYLKAYKVKWNVDNKDRRVLYGLKSEAKNKESRRAQCRAYYYRNKPKFAAKYRSWYEKNKARCLARNSARQRKIYCDTPISEMDKIETWLRIQHASDNLKCSYCETPINKFDVDHIIPLSRGGKHELANICIACQPCNRSKSNKLLSEWNRKF